MFCKFLENSKGRTFGVEAKLRAVVLQCGALVHIVANLGVVLGGDVAAVARADVSATRQVLATVFASAVGRVGARTLQVAASFIRFVFAVVLQRTKSR
jgi:hypothetical protein